MMLNLKARWSLGAVLRAGLGSVMLLVAVAAESGTATITTVYHRGCQFASPCDGGGVIPPLAEGLALAVADSAGAEAIVKSDAGGVLRLELPASGGTRVRSGDSRWWSGQVEVNAEQQEATLHVFAAGTIQGTVLADPGYEVSELSVRFIPSGGDVVNLLRETATIDGVDSNGLPMGEADCFVRDDHRFSCAMPLGSYHARIRAEGLAARFLWELVVEADTPTDLREVRLFPAATLTGQLLTASGEPVPEDCILLLTPEGQERPDRSSQVASQGEVSAAGRFQIQDVTNGLLCLHTLCPGYAPAEVHQISVADGKDVLINDPIILSPAFALEGDVLPPATPLGDRWRIALTGQDRRSRLRFEAVADDLGRWRIEDMQSGQFDTEVRSDGEPITMRFSAAALRVDPEPAPVLVEVDLVQVDGTVFFGEAPLQATVTFGLSADPNRTVPFFQATSHDDGSFVAWLSDARWKEGIDWPWPVIVDSTDPKLHIEDFVGVRKPTERGKHASVTIRIPNTIMRGRVVDSKDSPVPGASVFVESTDSSGDVGRPWFGSGGVKVTEPEGVVSDDAGKFEVVGLPEGTVRARAKDRNGRQSKSVSTFLNGAEHPSEVLLRIEDHQDVPVHFVSESQPVAHATVDVLAEDSHEMDVYVTDDAGIAHVSVPRSQGQTTVLLSTSPPGRCLTSTALRVGTSGTPAVVDVPSQGCGTVKVVLPMRSVDTSQFLLRGEGGAFTTFRLDSWVRSNASATEAFRLVETIGTGQPYVVPRVAPGLYTACLFSSREAYYQFMMYGVAGAAECVGGKYLAPFGTVVFDLSER